MCLGFGCESWDSMEVIRRTLLVLGDRSGLLRTSAWRRRIREPGMPAGNSKCVLVLVVNRGIPWRLSAVLSWCWEIGQGCCEHQHGDGESESRVCQRVTQNVSWFWL